jgi:hypothetical protein
VTREESIALGKAAAVFVALRDAARAAWGEGRLRDAAKLFARRDIAESRALELEYEIRFPELDARITFADVLSMKGRPLL